MSTQLLRTILRLVAVLTVFVGVLCASATLLTAFAMSFFVDSLGRDSSIRSSVSGMGMISVFSWLVVIAWGVALFHWSPGIARLITSEPEAQSAPKTSPRPRLDET